VIIIVIMLVIIVIITVVVVVVVDVLSSVLPAPVFHSWLQHGPHAHRQQPAHSECPC
jgi:flagellar basal body-associated protein FliL